MTHAPEFRIALFGFLTAFFWEMWQMPFYDIGGASMVARVRGCSIASVGDAGIMVFAYVVASWMTGTRLWLTQITLSRLLVYLGTGLAITVAIEHVALNVDFGWRYSELMPIEPIIGTGLVPLAMWVVVPLVTLWLARLPSLRI